MKISQYIRSKKTGAADGSDKRVRINGGLVAAWAIPTGIMLVIFFLKSIFPFGGRSFLYMDMYHQYMPFYSLFYDKLREGGSLFYTWNVGIGSNFLALYVYYLACPLHFLGALVPKTYILDFLSYLVVCKVGLCGLTACLYLQRRSHSRSVSCVIFSCLYALSGFMAAYNWNIMWLDPVILLPLILLGLELLVKEGRCGLYCVALALAIYTNFYLSIMICIFLVLYFLVLILTEKCSFRILGEFALFSMLAGGMAAVLLVPEACALFATDFGHSSFPAETKTYFSVLEELARHCLCVSTERGLNHWPNIFCGVAAFLLVPLYAVNPGIPLRKRFAHLALAGFMLISFGTNVLDFLWHGFNYPDSLPGRQTFIYIFLILIMCHDCFRHLRELEPKYILYSYLGMVVFLLCCQQFIDHEDFSDAVWLITLVFVTLYAVLMHLYRTRQPGVWTKGLAVITLLAVMLETGINTYDTSVGTTSRSAYLGQLENYEALYDLACQREAEAGNEAVFRMEKFARVTKNDGTLAGYPTASVFSSTMNSTVADLYERLGMRHSKVYYSYDGATAFLSALLNVNYLYGEADEETEEPEEEQEDKEEKVQSEENGLYSLVGSRGKVALYACEATLPFGYVAPLGYDLPEGYKGEPLKLQNEMAEQLGVSGQLFQKAECKQAGEKVTMTAKRDGYYYMLLTGSGTKKIAMTGALERKYADLKIYSVLYVGYLEKGQSVTFANDDDSDDTPEFHLSAWRMDEEVLEEALEVLGEQHLEEVSYDDTHVSGRLELTEAGRLILSIPYAKGWTVLVNGEKTEPALVGECLMALDLEPGSYRIELEYVPYGLKQGILLSAVSILVFAGIMLLRHRKRYAKNVVGRGHPTKAGMLLLVTAVLLCGCAEGSAEDGEQVAGKTYVYTGEPFSDMENDLFKISFNEDGTFSYCESMFSSYLGYGTWEIKDGVLIMSDDEHIGYPLRNFFRIDGEELVFVEEGSSNFIYVKVQDGERFAAASDTDG